MEGFFSSKALLILGQIASTGNAFRSVSSIIASALAKTSENTECLKFSPTPKFFCQIFVFKGPAVKVVQALSLEAKFEEEYAPVNGEVINPETELILIIREPVSNNGKANCVHLNTPNKLTLNCSLNCSIGNSTSGPGTAIPALFINAKSFSLPKI